MKTVALQIYKKNALVEIYYKKSSLSFKTNNPFVILLYRKEGKFSTETRTR